MGVFNRASITASLSLGSPPRGNKSDPPGACVCVCVRVLVSVSMCLCVYIFNGASIFPIYISKIIACCHTSRQLVRSTRYVHACACVCVSACACACACACTRPCLCLRVCVVCLCVCIRSTDSVGLIFMKIPTSCDPYVCIHFLSLGPSLRMRVSLSLSLSLSLSRVHLSLDLSLSRNLDLDLDRTQTHTRLISNRIPVIM